MHNDQTMKFMYATDENFVHVTATSMYSLMKQHVQRAMRVHIVLDQDVTHESRALLQKIGKKFGKEIVLIDMPDFASLTNTALDIKRYSLSMFSRLMVGTLLPREAQRVIYLDADTLICDDLYPLWMMNLGEKVVGAVNDFRSKAYSHNLGIKQTNCYINSGILLIDLEKYRARRCEERLLGALGKLNGLLEFPDNDLICKVLQDEIALLPVQYNMTSALRMCGYRQLLWLRHPAFRITEKMFEQANQRPAILHFTTFFLMKRRPWIEGCDHPDAQRYVQLRMEATGTPLEKMTQKSGARQRLINAVMYGMPRPALIFIAGILHAYIKPWKQGLRMKKCREQM